MHVTVAGRHGVSDPRVLGILGLLIPGDTAVVGAAAPPLVLVGRGNDRIFAGLQLAGGKTVAHIAWTDEVFGPM